MKNNITELVFILDRSGSMAGLESDTIGGFNAMIEKQKKERIRLHKESYECLIKSIMDFGATPVAEALGRRSGNCCDFS